MIKKIDKNKERVHKHKSIRLKINGTEAKPRLAVYRSLTNISAQIIDDEKQVTLVSAGTMEKEIADKVKGKTKTEAAKIVGEFIGKRAKAKKITEVVFDRGGYVYIGRVAALAEGARSAGLRF